MVEFGKSIKNDEANLLGASQRKMTSIQLLTWMEHVGLINNVECRIALRTYDVLTADEFEHLIKGFLRPALRLTDRRRIMRIRIREKLLKKTNTRDENKDAPN